MSVNFAIGVSDFAEIINLQRTYIDKTLLIKDLINDPSKVILFPRPRRFGKTLNLSMLRYFLDLRGPSSGHLFNDLLVSKHPEIMAHQGKYPVIFISLKEIKADSYSLALEKIAIALQRLFLQFQDLQPKFSEIDHIQFENIIRKTASEAELSNALLLLSQILEKIYSQKVWILIDEYDTPIHEAWIHGYYDKIKSFMQGFLGSALKDNTAVYKSILTGILRVSKEGMFSDLNNLMVYSMLSESYGEYFGFTESEVDNICKIADLSDQREAVRAWYNGYKFGELNIYNPWSIINFAKNKKLEPYWVNTGSSAIIESLIAKTSDYFKSDFEVLVQGGTLTKSIDERIVLPEINSNAEDAIWSFLVFSGYLKVVHKQSTNQTPICQIQIPNEEILGIYQSYFAGWLKKNNPRQNEIMLEALVSGEVELFEELFTNYVEKTLSYFDVEGTNPEKFYHALILGILVTLRNSHQILSNRESGYGRYDIMICPKDLSKLGIIIEFKSVKKEDLLEKAATEALDQIQAKNYQAELEARGIKNILKLAIVFFGKKILIKK
jgi:hypothetical protein